MARGRVDAGLALLFHTVLDDAWEPGPAGRALRARLCEDSSTLRLMRARVSRRLLDRPTPLARRAAQTIDAALAYDAEVALTS